MPHQRPTVEFVRSLYEDSKARISDIAVIAGVGERTIGRYAKKENWRRRGRGTGSRRRLGREGPTAEMSKHRSSADAPDRRRALVERLYAAAEKHLDAIEAQLTRKGRNVPLESAVPHFALFSRTVQQIAMIDQVTAPAGNNDEFPRSDDELRRELMRKMDALVATRAPALSGEPDAG